jgi:hypothetical protein
MNLIVSDGWRTALSYRIFIAGNRDGHMIAGMGFALANPMPAAPRQIYFGLLNPVGSGLVFS